MDSGNLVRVLLNSGRSPDQPRGEDMDKAILVSQLTLALGFLVFIVRALGERVQELRGN